jgi:DNA-binding PadR family transcriptional regulator
MRHDREPGCGRSHFFDAMFRHRDHRRDPPGHGPGRHRGGRGGRLFDYGELRLLILALLAEEPRHGYELIKAIEERLSGSYSPSPGVIYPTLAWAEDMGYAVADAEGGGRKTYRLTPEGEAFLTANRAAADELLQRGATVGPGGRPGLPAPVLRAMENLKLALRLRLREGAMTAAQADAIAAALDAAAQAVEKSR